MRKVFWKMFDLTSPPSPMTGNFSQLGTRQCKTLVNMSVFWKLTCYCVWIFFAHLLANRDNAHIIVGQHKLGALLLAANTCDTTTLSIVTRLTARGRVFPRSIVCKAVCNMAAPGTGGVFALTWDRCSHKLTTTNMMRSLPLESTINSAFTLGHPDTEDKIQAFASTSTTNFTNKFDVDLLLTFLSVLLLIILRIKLAINYLCWQCMPKFLKGQKQGHKQCIEGC